MKDKVVVITGGSSGIGKALSEEFGKRGAKIVITGRNGEKLKAQEKALADKGIETLSVVCDVSLKEDNFRMADEAVKRFGRIDILVNNAGISMRALFKDLDLDVMERLMDINFYGTVYATKACLQHIIEAKGSIIGVSSIAGYRGLPARAGYSASKFAMQGFLEVLRTEMLAEGVHVLTACPGFTASNIRKTALAQDGSQQGETPLDEGKIMSAEEVAKRIVDATQAKKKHLVLTSQGILTVWLNKFFPGFMDKMVYNVMAKEPNSPLKPLK